MFRQGGPVSKAEKSVLRLALRGQRKRPIRLLARAPGLVLNDDQRGRDVD